MRPPDGGIDVAIIGAGPAGSAAAIRLARSGRRVVLIEKKRFPREKVCGGCLSGAGTAGLRELLGPDRPLPGIPGARVSFIIGSYRLTCRPRGETRMVPRSVLDTLLADTAAAAGAEVRYGMAAGLERTAAGWEVVVGDERIRARTILLACGFGGLVRRLGIQGRSVRRRLFGQMWFQPPVPPLPEVGALELHWLRGGYVGLATPDVNHCVVAIAADTADQRDGGAFDTLRRRNPDAPIWQAIPADAPRRFDASGIAGFPWEPERLGVDNVLLVGDAAGFVEPYSGEGMGQAMRSARCAAAAILEGGDPLPRYTALMRGRHRRTMRRIRFVGRILGARPLHFLAERRPILPRGLLVHLVKGMHVKGTL